MKIKGIENRQIKPQVAATFKKGAPKKPNRPGENLSYFRLDWSEYWQEKHIALSEDVLERYSVVYQMLRHHAPSRTMIDYFRSQQSITAPELFNRLYGNEPKSVVIANVELDSAMKKFGGNAMIWACDGHERCINWTQNGYSNIPQPCLAPNGVLEMCKQENQCDFSGELRFTVPDFSAFVNRQVFFVLYTKSANEIAVWQSTIEKNSTDMTYELYRYDDSFTIPISGKPSRTKQSMVGLMPFARPRIEPQETPQLPAPIPMLTNGDSDDESDDSQENGFDSWLTEMSDLLYDTEFSTIGAFLANLNQHRKTLNPLDTQATQEILYEQWPTRSEQIKFKIASGLAEMESVIKVRSLDVYQWNNDLRYEIQLPFCELRFFSLDVFRKAGYEKIDDCKMPPMEYAKLIYDLRNETGQDVKLMQIMETVQGEGYDYLNTAKTAWSFPLQYLEGALEDDSGCFVPIVLKVHTKQDKTEEIQIRYAISNEGDIPF